MSKYAELQPTCYSAAVKASKPVDQASAAAQDAPKSANSDERP